MIDNAEVVLVLEPRDIDNLLDYGVSIWIASVPARIELLEPYDGAQLAANAIR
jgi:hypothetical protein